MNKDETISNTPCCKDVSKLALMLLVMRRPAGAMVLEANFREGLQ
jgi:hypothetical protein